MRLIVASVGRLKKGPETDLCERYHKRSLALGRSLGLGSVDVLEVPEGRSSATAARQAEEAKALETKLKGATLVLLDERGKAVSSQDFANLVGNARDSTKDIAFVIGGPDGFATDFRQSASQIISFGAMTMPHQLVRVALLEQVYRALTILSGHPYHRQ